MDKTISGRAMECLNQFLISKESGVLHTQTFQMFMDSMISLGIKQIEKGVWSEAEMQDFEDFLPASKAIFTNPEIHPDSIANSQAKFKESARVAMLSSSMTEEPVAKTM